MIFLLFGPPGIGKSSICNANEWLDLEDLDPISRLRWLERNTTNPGHDDLVVGAADINPDTIRKLCLRDGSTAFITLTLSDVDYAARRQERDKKWPFKANQPVMKVSDFIVSPRDGFEVNADGTITEVTQRIIRAIKKFKEERKNV